MGAQGGLGRRDLLVEIGRPGQVRHSGVDTPSKVLKDHDGRLVLECAEGIGSRGWDLSEAATWLKFEPRMEHGGDGGERRPKPERKWSERC